MEETTTLLLLLLPTHLAWPEEQQQQPISCCCCPCAISSGGGSSLNWSFKTTIPVVVVVCPKSGKEEPTLSSPQAVLTIPDGEERGLQIAADNSLFF